MQTHQLGEVNANKYTVMYNVFQATMLLTMNKYSMQDAKDIQKATFKLNSLQLKKLMNSYLYATKEPLIPPVSTHHTQMNLGSLVVVRSGIFYSKWY